MNTVVAYYRVSTKGQESSGLGLDAQRVYVDRWVNQNSATIVKEFQEVESGGKTDRPLLKEAIKICKDHDHVLLVAKLDRLSRSVSLTASLLEEKGFRFVCCDMPEANELTIHIIAAMAENERKLISKRTKEALKAKKVRDPNWRAGAAGKRNLTLEGRVKGGEVIRKRYRESPEWRQACAAVKNLAESGHTQKECVEWLNDNEFKTTSGKRYTLKDVRNIGGYVSIKWRGPGTFK
jgi:DNA invertase Pin-like site-specific DNA recombinase